MAAAPSAQARVTLQDAFERFASTVAPDDKRLFHNTQLKDVRDEAIRIERQLRARRTQRCMARLDKFLQGMEHYSKVVEVLCNGTPFLPWIWAPVKLMLMITADSISAFEKFIEAYGKIGDIVSRMDRLGDALVNDHNFQNVLALVYSDIVEFHRRAYKFVRRKSWSIFFSSTWAGFESRFSGILNDLAYHTELADKEAAAADIAESVRRSKADDENWEQQEREWTAVKIQKVLAWLGTTDTLPANLLDWHLRDYLPRSCDWFIQHKATELWLGDSAKIPLLWLCGKPGAGKSMICSALVQHTEANDFHVFYYFCSFRGSRSDGPSRLLRSLISQVIQKHQDLAIYVHDVCFKSNPQPTKKALLTLLPELLRGLGSVRLIVDGIDEWTSRDQKELLDDLSQMVSTDQSSHVCKIMVASRDTMATSRRKKDKLSTMISLSGGDEGLAVTRAIASFINDKLSDLPEHFEQLDPDSSIMAHVKKTLLEKSQGMFLWVSLVLESLDTVYSPEELRTIVDDLPSDLEDLYKRIVTRLCSAPGAQSYGGVPRIMSWICFSRRPLHKSELLQALSMFSDDIGTQMRSIPVASILDHCKPLIEELPDSTIVPVHFSVKEYFLKAQIPQILPAVDVALNISCACAIVIIRGLELVRLGSNSSDYLALIASGNYRLLPYAIEFWIEHCLQYASRRDLRPGRPLRRHLDRLHGTHEDYLHAFGLGATQNLSPDWANIPHAENRLSLFLDIPIYGLMADVLSFRHLVSQLDGDNTPDIETYVVDNDRTLFSKLAHTYEGAVVDLLARREVEGITPAILRAFQESYASTAFRCRFPHCERLSLGFATAQLRLEHETVHVQRVYCQTVSCQYHRIGFVKRSALIAHTRKHHSQYDVLLIPAKVRRVTHAESKPEEPRQNWQGSSVYSTYADIRYLDDERFPPRILDAQIRENLPSDVETWARLRTWVGQNPTLAPGTDIKKVLMLQVLHHQNKTMKQQKSSGGERTQISPNAQQTQTPQQDRQDPLITAQTAQKLMSTAKPEPPKETESDVDRWPLESRNKKRRLMNGQDRNQQQQPAVLEKQSITRSMRKRQSEAQQQTLQPQSMGSFEVQDQQEAQRRFQEHELRASEERSHHSPVAPGGAPPILQPVSSSSGMRSLEQQMQQQQRVSHETQQIEQRPRMLRNYVYTPDGKLTRRQNKNAAPAPIALGGYQMELMRLEQEKKDQRLREKREREEQQQSAQEQGMRHQKSTQQQQQAYRQDPPSFQDLDTRSSPVTARDISPTRRGSAKSRQDPPDLSLPSSDHQYQGYDTNSFANSPRSWRAEDTTASPRQRSTLDLARLQMQESSPPVPSWRNHLPNQSYSQETATSSPPSPSDRLLPTSTPQGYPWGQRQSSSGNGDTAPNMFTFGSASSDDYYDKLELELDDPVQTHEQQPSFAEVHRRARNLPLPVDDMSADADLRKLRGPIFSARDAYYD